MGLEISGFWRLSFYIFRVETDWVRVLRGPFDCVLALNLLPHFFLPLPFLSLSHFFFFFLFPFSFEEKKEKKKHQKMMMRAPH